MSFKLNKYQLEKYSRQIILKDVGALGQKKIIKSFLPWLKRIILSSPL